LLLNTASGNTAIGFNSLRCNTTGIQNVGVGVNTLRFNTVGNANTSLGHSSLYNTTTGSGNTAVGRLSAGCNTSGIDNTAVGFCSLPANTTGSSNTAVGVSALTCNTSGCYNIALGASAQQCVTTNSYTIAVGVGAKTDNTDYHTVWGSPSNSVCNCVYTEWTNVSDCRDKVDIQVLPQNLGLNLIKKLRPVKFKWDHRDVYVKKCGFEYGQKDGTLKGEKDHYGLIAQELKNTLNELNVTFDALGYSEDQDAYRLAYTELIAPIIKAIQELEERVSNLENQ
jgi:hypothetical protein